jgi:urea carboxylase-associated protein 2
MKNIPKEDILFEKTVEGGWSFSHIVKKGTAVRLTDLEGGANVSALFYNASNVTERYNMGDTLKTQHISHISKHDCIYSDMGRILMSVVDETCGWHDVICGVSDRDLITRKYGESDYDTARNDYYRNGYDSLLTELYKHGMGKRDFTDLINFFSKVNVDRDGNLSFIAPFSNAGDYVDLRAEMNTLLVFDTGMHPLNPSGSYERKPVRFTIFKCDPASDTDPCRLSCPENVRGFENTELSWI